MDILRKKSKRIIKHPFFSGSLIMIIGSNIANIFAYTYHIIFGRILSVAEYGNLASFLSLIGLLGMILGFIGLVVVKFVASAKKDEIPAMMRWFTEKVTILTLIICIIIFIFSRNISDSLKIPYEMVLLLIPTYLVANFMFLMRSFLQGLMKFKVMVIVNNINLFFRIAFGALFVYMGLSAFGASAGLLMGMLIAFFIFLNYFKKYEIFKAKKNFSYSGKIIKYSLPIFASSVATTALLSLDLILVKYYFSPEEAGMYAAVSVLGKIIFYATAPIGSVMFPMISNRYSEGKSYLIIFWLSGALSLIAALAVTTIYFVLPNLAILPLYGSKYLSIANYLGYYAIFITLFSLSSLIVSLYQSIEKPQIGYLLSLSVVGQLALIYFYHDSLFSIIFNLIIIMSATLVSLLIYMLIDIKKSYAKAK